MSYKAARSEATEHRDPIQETADKIIAALESGVKPWVRPWDEQKCGGPNAPMNAVTRHHYRGINVLLLGMDMRAFATGDPRWMTYTQASEAGYQVRKGEKATTIFFTKPLEIDDEGAKDGKKTLRFMKSFAVFHASQVDGVSPYKPPTVEEAPWTRPEASDIILRNSGAIIRTGGERAFYSPLTDHIQLPPESAFKGPSEYAGTALHELGHYSGHPSRLDRNLAGRFGSEAYALEELRAEMASAFICAQLGLPTDLPNHASYIQNWLKPLKDDKREIFRAAADAQRIADWVLNFHPDFVLNAIVEGDRIRDTHVSSKSVSTSIAERGSGTDLGHRDIQQADLRLPRRDVRHPCAQRVGTPAQG